MERLRSEHGTAHEERDQAFREHDQAFQEHDNVQQKVGSLQTKLENTTAQKLEVESISAGLALDLTEVRWNL